MYLKSNTLLLADVFENCKKICLEIYELDPTKFLLAPRLAWQAVFKKTKVKSELLTDIDMILMVEKGIRGGLCHSINIYEKVNNEHMRDYDKNLDILNIGMKIISMVGQCHKNCLQMDLSELKIFPNLMNIS